MLEPEANTGYSRREILTMQLLANSYFPRTIREWNILPASSTYLKYATADLSNDEEKILREATDAFTKNIFSGKITATDMCQSEMFSR